ncbi:hypothetical protein [Terrimonas alba]|uniref:hypothetical protein n=1 Tax=Terrimonas alba TaxID=3349636 RepID=UPI0035F286B2
MPIDFESEITEISGKLSQVEGYLSCEKIIVRNIQKQFQNGKNDENILAYLRGASDWFNKQIKTGQQSAESVNYMYASGFIDTLLKMSYWKNWVRTIDR